MTEFLKELLQIIRPLLELLVSIGGPILVGWLVTKISATLNIQDAAKKAELEEKLRNALHAAALNGLKFAIVKAGFKNPVNEFGLIRPDIIAEAVRYVRDKNPDGIKDLAVTEDKLIEIITSKLPGLVAPKQAQSRGTE